MMSNPSKPCNQCMAGGTPLTKPYEAHRLRASITVLGAFGGTPTPASDPGTGELGNWGFSGEILTILAGEITTAYSQLIGLREKLEENPMIFMGKSMVSG